MHWKRTLAGAGLAALFATGFAAVGFAEDPTTEGRVDTVRTEFKDARQARALGIDKCLVWIERLYAVADAELGSDEGYEALALVLEISKARESGEVQRAAAGAFDRLVAGYANDVGKIGQLVAYTEDEAFVQRVMEATTDPSVRATVLYRDVSAAIDAGYAEPIPEELAAEALATARRIAALEGREELARPALQRGRRARRLPSSRTCASAWSPRTSRARTSTGWRSNSRTTGARWSCSTSGATGDPPAGPCTRTSGRS